jgi:hypothetical protein
VVFSCRAAIDTIDALALVSRTTLVVDPLSTTSRGSFRNPVCITAVVAQADVPVSDSGFVCASLAVDASH